MVLMYHFCCIVEWRKSENSKDWKITDNAISGTKPRHPCVAAEFSRVFCRIDVAPSVVLCVLFCRSLFVFLSFFCWPLYRLSYFDLWLLITTLVPSNLWIKQFYYLKYLLRNIYFTDEIACADPDKCLEFCGNKAGYSNIAYPLIVMRLMPEGKYSIFCITKKQQINNNRIIYDHTRSIIHS